MVSVPHVRASRAEQPEDETILIFVGLVYATLSTLVLSTRQLLGTPSTHAPPPGRRGDEWQICRGSITITITITTTPLPMP